MKRLFPYLKPHVPHMGLGLAIKFTGTLLDLLLPWILSHIIDRVAPYGDVPRILFWGGVMILCALAALVTNVVANRMASRVARDATQSIRHDLFARITGLSCRQADGYSIPSLEARLTSDTYHVHQMIGMMQRLGVRAPILLLGGLFVTFALDPALALVLVSTLPFIGVLVAAVSRRGIPLYSDLQRGVDAMVRTIRENITGIRVTKALSATEREKRRFDAVNADVSGKEKRSGVAMAVTGPVMNLLLNLGLTCVILVGACRVDAGLTQPGKIIAFLSYFIIILNAMLSVSRLFTSYSRGSASAARIAQVLDTPGEPDPPAAPPGSDAFHIEYEAVSFSYLKKRDDLADISFTLRRGETLGVIGATGSGKSTLAALLMRLYDSGGGVVRIGGRSVADIPPDELHTKFGVVFQDDVLFAGTIAANIDFGRGLPQRQIEKAVGSAQAAGFAAAFPDGLAHVLPPRGASLSGGQKQRLLLARALAGEPEILILDDCSSALDYQTDARFRRALRENYGGVTTVIIAQRVSSLRHADKILVLDEGRAVGCGTHEELLAACAIYREIYNAQMGDGPIA